MTGPRGGGAGRRRGPGRSAVLGSVTLHLAAVAGLWVAGLSHAAPLPPLKSYRVDIVSPPPVERGPVQPVEQAEPEPTPPASEPEPQPDPTPVVEEPKPAPPEPKPE